MKKKSLYWLISTLSIAVSCYFVYMYQLNERNRNGSYDYSISYMMKNGSLAFTEAKEKLNHVDTVAVDKKVVDKKAKSIVSEDKNSKADAVKVAHRVIKKDSTTKSDKKLYSVKISNANQESDIEPLIVNNENKSVLTNNIDNENFEVDEVSVDVSLTNTESLKPENNKFLIVSKDNYPVNSLLLTSDNNKDNTLLTYVNNAEVSQNNQVSVDYNSIPNGLQSSSSSDLIAMNQPSIQTSAANLPGRQMRTNGTGLPTAEDEFASGGGVDNTITYNDNNVMGSLPISDGSSFLLVLSLIFITIKSFRLKHQIAHL